ncbi:MAG: matrixin family metalloprotease [Gammaproteobacteria bacterium]
MYDRSRSTGFGYGILILAGLTSCSQENTPETGATTEPVPTMAEATEFLKAAAEQDREKLKGLSFDAFKAKVYREPFAGGKYIVNGDTPILNEKQLQEFFDTQVKKKPQSQPTERMRELIVHQIGGLDAVWNSMKKRQLSYCVSQGFGARHAKVVSAMEAAGRAWEGVADIGYIHIAQEDDNCTPANTNVAFDVRPVDVNGQYLARAFFPNEPRGDSNVLIDNSAFELDPSEKLNLTGILRHELGHTLGFRHEHTRPSSGPCFEDANWRPLTNYDPFSVMHYPQCEGRGDWSLTLTTQDKNGAACLYGAATGFTIDTGICRAEGSSTPPRPGTAQTQSFAGQHVGANEEKPYGPFSVASGTLFEAKMQSNGSNGDPDLYVRFGVKPRRSSYDCRPYLAGANETCSVNVPSGKNQAHVMVHGYSAGGYKLTVTHTPPSQ